MEYNPFSISGKTIFITGATGGIGKATAIECAKMGATLYLSGRNSEKLQSVWNDIKGYTNRKEQLLSCDLSDFEQVKELAAKLPILDGVVFNAGISKLKPVKYIKEDDFKKILDINLISSAVLLGELLKQKKLKDGSSVVFTSSAAGLYDPVVGNAMYSASKGAVCAFAKNVALELAPRKIRVNSVCPGMVNTQMIKVNDGLEYSDNGGVKEYPLGRYADPKEIAWAFIYLLSDASKWVTGTDFIIDGGLHIG